MSDRGKKDEQAIARLAEAFRQFSETGSCQATCDVCGAAISFEAISDSAAKSHCDCGKYNETLRGI